MAPLTEEEVRRLLAALARLEALASQVRAGQGEAQEPSSTDLIRRARADRDNRLSRL
jgi:hypothetical protein